MQPVEIGAAWDWERERVESKGRRPYILKERPRRKKGKETGKVEGKETDMGRA